MKHMTQTVLAATVAMAAFAGVAQAGRGIDNPVPMNKGVAAESAADAGGAAYTGRPNETIAVVPARNEGVAEFAVMSVQGGGADRGMGAYHGRPMDNPAR